MSADPHAAAEGESLPTVSRKVKVLAALLALVLALVGGEVLIRIVAPQAESWLDIYARRPGLETYAIESNVHRLVDTGETRWEVDTDELGFRVISPGPTDRKGVLFLGDSFTFGNGVHAKDSYVGLLHANRVLGLSYLNAGVPGYGPIQYRQVLEYYLTNGFTPPRVIIGAYVGNDFHDCVWKAAGWVVDGILGNRGGVRSFVKRHFHGYRLIAGAYHRLYPERTNAFAFREEMFTPRNWDIGVLKEGLARMREEFAAIAKVCGDRGIPLLVVVIPIRDAVEPGDTKGGDRDPSLPVAKALDILSTLRIPALDLTPHLSGRPVNEMFFAHDGHLTAAGNRAAFEAIRDELVRENH